MEYGDCISRQVAVKKRSPQERLIIAKTLIESVLDELPSAQYERPPEIQDILDYLDTVLHPILSPDHWNVYSELHDMISMLPFAKPEIIRCGQCKHADEYNHCAYTTWWTRADDYCSRGKRREG